MKKISSIDDKYHIILIYLVEDDGSYGDGYYEPIVDLMGGVAGDSIDELVNEAYKLLELATKAIDNMPFDINNVKNSVHFDLVECHDKHEMDTAHD
ncbi:hypothetical protein I4U23_010733 [Adineta vaga]|nr:hypothetical protein I4U23_010733 [Adineta vaga]